MEVYINEEDTKEISELEQRWNHQKIDLLKPLATGSSFMENAISPNTMIPMSFIQSGDSMVQGESPDYCLNYFNPTSQASFDQTLNGWTNAVASLSIKSRSVHANAAMEAIKRHPEAFRQKIQAEPQPESPLWFALKALGLIAVIYIAVKWYKVKQGKSAEAAPLNAQMD